MKEASRTNRTALFIFLHLMFLPACQGKRTEKQVIVMSFDDIAPGGLLAIEETCSEIKRVMKGTQEPKVCLEAAVGRRLVSELCGRIDAGWDECLPLLRLKDGKATLETPQVTYVVTQLQRVYP